MKAYKKSNIKIFVEKCRDSAILPEYANPGDAGMDVHAAQDTELSPGETKIIPTGLKLAIPDGYEIQVRPRSGISLKTPLRLANSPGTIDSGYRDELGIIMTNTACEGIYLIKKGDRIAQILLAPVYKIEFEEVERVEDIGENRGGGFGSSGI